MKVKMMSNKNKLTLVLAIVLVAALAIGGTLAYLSAETENIENEFSFVDSDGGSDPDMKVDIDETWVPDDGKNMIPGDVVTKKPFVKNISDKDIDEWVAMSVIIKKGDGTVLTTTEATLFDQYFDIDFETNGETPGTIDSLTWTKLGINLTSAGASIYEGVYMYNAKVGKGLQSEPLFTEVKYSLSADNDVATELKDDWGGFVIDLKAYAVQGPNVEWATLPTIWAAEIQ